MRRAQVLKTGVLSLGLLGSLVACGTGPDQSSSDVKVTNGREVQEGEFDSVVLLVDQKAGSICTGTLIRPTVVLTAAHCSMTGSIDSEGNVRGELSVVKVRDFAKKEVELIATSSRIVRNPLWDANGKNVNKFDLGLVFFDKPLPFEVSELASRPAQVGDNVEIVGYGLNQSGNIFDSSSAGVKRFGTNRVQNLNDGFIQFSGANKTTTANGTNSSASSGDSGGPLFIKGQVAGVTSGGGWGGFGKTVSLYINLWSPESQAFLKKNLK